jgi:hypothetical protein
MHAKKVAGRHWLGPSGEMDPKARAAAAAAANALFIFLLSEPRRQKLPRQVERYAHSQVVMIRRCCDFFLNARPPEPQVRSSS